jgi:transposase
MGAAKQRRARILLLSDENHVEGGLTDQQIAPRVGLSERQVVRIRQRFVREGDQTLERKPKPPVRGELGGKAEAHLVVLCCSDPPKGRQRWTLQLLCDELGRLKLVESVCPETVRKSLKKNRPQALADRAVLHSGSGSGAIRRPDGRSSGRLPRNVRRDPPADLHGRSLAPTAIGCVYTVAG